MTRDTFISTRCFLCDTAPDRVLWYEKGYSGLSCASCGMLYTDRQGAELLADPTIEHHHQKFYSLPAKIKASWMAKNCPSGRLLEIGCGRGFFLDAARAYGYTVCGIEPNASLAKAASEEFGFEVEQSFFENSRLPRSYFDVVYHCDLLVHFTQPLRQIERMCSFLRPGGVLCFEVGILGGISPIWYSLIGELGLGQHLWLYSDRALKKLFNQSDLNVEKVQRFGLAPEVILGRVVGVFCHRILKPFFRAAQPLGILPAPEVAQELEWTSLNFLRYSIGYYAPRVGPQTLFVVARPTK